MRSHHWLIVHLVALGATVTFAQLDVNLRNVNISGINSITDEPTKLEVVSSTATVTQDAISTKAPIKIIEPSSLDAKPPKDYPKGVPKEEPLESSVSSIKLSSKADPQQEQQPSATTIPKKSIIVNAPIKSKVNKINEIKKNDIEHSEIGKSVAKSENADDKVDDEDYNYYDYQDYYDDDDKESSTSTTLSVMKKEQKEKDKLKPIKGNDKNINQDENKMKQSNDTDPTIDLLDDDDDDDDDDSDNDSDEYDDDDDQEPDTSGQKLIDSSVYLDKKNHSCPMNCVCERNFNGFIVANCDRLDPKTMKFDDSITDLEILNVPAKFPFVFGAGFFKSLGLKYVSSIKIADSSIENIHPSAFEGLDELYSVNLTNTGLDMIHPDTFATNTKLRILTLSGNDLHAMQKKISPYINYMLKAPSVEELYLSHCNIQQLLPTAFNELSNIVFISLADNHLRTLPHGIFDNVETIEELDLSSNSISNLPKNIFNKTSLAIMNLRYNEISGKLDFVATDLQKLDLSYNKLMNIHELMFSNMIGLNDLNLRGNSIKKIHEAAFLPLKDLRHIDLSFNRLEQISSLIFLGNPSLDVIRLNDNSALKKLPLDGFVSTTGHFKVYLFDASNCDISELGDTTFATMNELTQLNLAWNNIETLGEGPLLSFLGKLIELDLSNNLINELNDLVFLHNRNLRKLNLAGNPLETLSSRVFLPTKELSELDLSDCSLKTIWTETNLKLYTNTTFKHLRLLNVSYNMIERISQTELEVMDNLSVLDLSNNKMKCDPTFKSLMKWLDQRKITAGHLRRFLRENAEMKNGNEAEQMTAIPENASPWQEFTQYVCRKNNKQVIDTENDIDDGDDDDDEEEIDSDDEDEDSSDSDDEDSSDSDDQEGRPIANEKSENYDDSDDDDDSADYDSDEDEIKVTSGKVKDGGLIAEEVSIIKKVGDMFEDDEEVMPGRRKYALLHAGQYGYLLPILIIVFSVLAILLLVGKIMAVLMRRRGERYRQALLASKNSIVYQKLSEEIGGPTTPKFHRYAPINQV